MPSYCQTSTDFATGRPQEFVLCKELDGLGGPVNALLFSEDADLLLSGGDDERVHVWDTETWIHLQTLKDDKWGQITTLTWVFHERRIPHNNTWLCVGSGRGLATLCPLVKNHSSENRQPFAPRRAVTMHIFNFNDAVEAAAYDAQNSRLAFASHSGCLKMYKFDKGNSSTATPTIQELWSKRIGDAIPRSVFFIGDAHRNLLTLCLETAEMSCWDTQNGQVVWRKGLAGGIGSATLSANEQLLLIDNLTTGLFDMYQLPSQTPLRSFQSPAARHFIKQCAFLEGTETVVLGSAKNVVRIMDITSGGCLQVLKTEKEDMLQAIAVSTSQPGRHLIAAGSGSTPAIYLWETSVADEPEQDTVTEVPVESERPNSGVNNSIVLLMLILTYANWSPHLYRLLLFLSNFFERGSGGVQSDVLEL